MRHLPILLLAAAFTVVVASCEDKKPSDTIIAPKPVKVKPAAPIKMQNYAHKEDVSWIGSTYTVSIERRCDTSLPMVQIDGARRYHDNKISMKVVRQDGTTFFERTFQKTDFSQYVDDAYLSKSALLGLVFEQADGDNLVFAASVGSPDELSDDYVPMLITLSRTGTLSIKKDVRQDMAAELEEDEGV